MAGTYTPKTGAYAGQSFPSRRQYLNQQARDQGFTSYGQKSKVSKAIRDSDEIQRIGKHKTTNDKTIDIYQSVNIQDLLDFIQKLPGNQTAKLVVETQKNTGSSKSSRTQRGWSTLVNNTKISLLKKEIDSRTLHQYINDQLSDAGDIYNVRLWVYRR